MYNRRYCSSHWWRSIIYFFSVWVFFHNHSRITGLQRKEEGIPLTCHYHFQPLHRHFGISQTITAESSSLHIGSDTLVSECKSLTTKLRALMVLIPFLVYCIRSCVFYFIFFFFFHLWWYAQYLFFLYLSF